MDELQKIVARLEIEDVIRRYARGVDRRDWALVEECFHEDATDQHGEFVGGPANFIEWVSNRHAKIPFSMHFLGNCLIEFECADSAFVETYFIALQRRESSAGTPDAGLEATDFEVFASYCDRFERREGIWRIAARQVVMTRRARGQARRIYAKWPACLEGVTAMTRSINSRALAADAG